MHASQDKSEQILLTLHERFETILEHLKTAKEFAKSTYQTDAFQIAEILMNTEGGFDVLYEYAPVFDDIGLFYGGPWQHASRLQAPLISGCLKGKGVYPIIEILSDLRMLAIATQKNTSEEVSAEEARTFLNEAMALNLELLFPAETEHTRTEVFPHRLASIKLFSLIADELGVASLHESVLLELEALCAQRPITNRPIKRIIKMAKRIPKERMDADSLSKLNVYIKAIEGAGNIAQETRELAAYRTRLGTLDEQALETEAKQFATLMTETGLSSPHHAVLLRHLRRHAKHLFPTALGLNDIGLAELTQNEELILKIFKVSILPSTSSSIYGLARMIERGLFSRNEIQVGLQNLITIDLQSHVRKNLLQHRTKKDGATANSLLLAGLLSVLGHPLGVGQGKTPTCQAARGISLWAQHAPGYLIKLLISAARDGFVQMNLEDTTYRSSEIPSKHYEALDLTLDAVSLVLVPHLDYIYHHMMIKVALRSEDGHKWINPALYGRWVQRGFASVFPDRAQTVVTNYEDFVRRFFATHHPAYNDAQPLMYPNPVGICVTNGHGDYLGPHAISLQRVQEDTTGQLRAYFYNPNNEGRQDWGMGVKPSIKGKGEEPGESSLPFEQFASRLYAFHYNPYEEGDAYAVPDKIVKDVEEAARKTWGRTFQWQNWTQDEEEE